MNEVIVSMNNISKTFPGVKALDNVHFELRSGEVMALLGENGAGKSTIMKILSGVYTRDGGTMEIFGKSYDDLTPKQAQEAGVAIIHQEARNILNELKIDIDPDQTVGDLPVSKQQMVEIAKALSIHAKILIMDEPTSALTAREIEDLFRIIKDLKAQGCGIVYISHRLEELAEIVDRVTIMRDGQYITDGNFKDMTMDQIITNMVGCEIKEKFPRVTCTKGKKVFEVKNLNAGRMVRDINFSLYEGEIVGFAGLMGAGRTETTRAIFGVDAKESGEFYLDGQKIEIHNPMDAIKNGVVLAPEDRLIICVSDDGVGMDEEKLAALNRKLGRANDSLNSSEEEKGGIALVNVNNRIHLIFGDEYGMHVYSVPQRGTDVEITIPLTENDREVKNRSVLK